MKTLKIKTVVNTGFAGCEHNDTHDTGISIEDWLLKTPDEQQKILDEYAETAVSDYIDAYAEVVE